MEITTTSGIALLKSLVSAAGWHSNETRFLEAMPHMADRLRPDELVETLENLGVPLRSSTCKLAQVTAQDCPALFIEPDGTPYAIIDVTHDMVLVAGVATEEPQWQKKSDISGLLVRLERFGLSSKSENLHEFSKVAGQFRGLLPWLAISSLMTNLMGLATPLLIMVIYDRVIPVGATNLLWSLTGAVALVIACDAGFRYARTAAIGHIGREIELKLGLALFRKLLSLPTKQIQRAEVEQQIARFKQFEGLRDVFTGQVLTTLMDLPFTILFCIVLFALSPKVALLILGLMVIFALATCFTLPRQRALNQIAAKHKADHSSLVFETMKNQQAIHRVGLLDHWSEQNAVLAQASAKATKEANNFTLFAQSFGQALMSIAGIGAVVLGTFTAMAGDMSFGALIAVLSLVWKTLSPLQALYSKAPQIAGFLQSKAQSDRVLNMPVEIVRGAAQTHQKTFEGRVSFTGVTHRYDGAVSYALSQVSLDIDAGEFVLIGGSNSSGKSSMLNLICNLHQPIAGSIHLDGVDLRQIPVDDLRSSITYVQPRPEFFYGTIFQNFRLATPNITEDEVEAILDQLSLTADIEQMPEGIHTRLTEAYRATLPYSVLHGLSLARGLSRPGSVLLLNEPTMGLDAKCKSALAHTLRSLKGQKTVIITSQDPVHMEIAERLIYLESGRVVLNDKSIAGYKKFAALCQKSKGS